jgi:2-polyprenyl-6-methoxyphenol hydroxylase-like FAD-dependent oxidoreductase
MSDWATQPPVLIVGAGPVGLTLALDLARRGVPSMIVERRRSGEPPSVKCNHVASRTMEAFRRLGLASIVRADGLPPDYPNDCVYRTTVAGGPEITRIPIPARSERATDFQGPDTRWPTPEPPHRINQIYLEPLIFAHAARNARITILNETELVDASQTDHGVSAQVRVLGSGEIREITADYLIGCDGGHSIVRRLIGATLHGDPVIQRVQSTYIRAPGLLARIPGRPGWMNLALNPRRCGNVVAIDGRERWLIHAYLYEGEEDFEAVDRDSAIRTILGVGADFEYEILSREDWIGRRLVADRCRDRRIFLCGDSAHLWVPYAGYGMNAGIADAMDLSWLLAASLQGWGGPHILDAYEAERLPITEQVSRFAMNHAFGAIAHRREVPASVEASGEAGHTARAALGRAVYDLNVQQYCCGGLNFGYFYDRSPLISYDDAVAPGFTMADFVPSTVPGCRTPHFWLREGRSAYEAFGAWFTLLRFDPAIDVGSLVAAAAERRVPLDVLDVAPDERTAVYTHALLLSRPDLHVGWRGDRLPDDARGLIDLMRGAGSAVNRCAS